MTVELDFKEAYEEYKRERHAAQAELTKNGMARKAESGGLNGPAPLGYVNRRRGEEAWVEIDPATAPQVREAFELLGQGLTLRATLAEMTAKGLRSKHGNEIGPGAFHKIVTNPFYAGLVVFEGVTRQGSHEALVPVDQFYRIQGRMQERR